jgi:hypothetical protein
MEPAAYTANPFIQCAMIRAVLALTCVSFEAATDPTPINFQILHTGTVQFI